MLLLPDRCGHGASPASGRADFEADAEDVAALLGERAHLVGHSYAAVVALLVAARRPEAVRTLTVVEPAAFAAPRGDPAVEELIATLADLQAAAPDLAPAEFVLRYAASGEGYPIAHAVEQNRIATTALDLDESVSQYPLRQPKER